MSKTIPPKKIISSKHKKAKKKKRSVKVVKSSTLRNTHMKNSIIDFKNNIKTLMSNEQTPLNLSRVTNKSQSKADIV